MYCENESILHYKEWIHLLCITIQDSDSHLSRIDSALVERLFITVICAFIILESLESHDTPTPSNKGPLRECTWDQEEDLGSCAAAVALDGAWLSTIFFAARM